MSQAGLWTVCALLGAGVASAQTRPKVLVLNLAVSDPSLQQLAATLSEQVLTELGKGGRLDSMGQSDVQAVLGLERQKQILGCSEETGCLAELSAALGAPWIVTGTLARLGKSIRIDLKLIRTRDGSAAWRDGRDTTDESAVFSVLTAMVKDLMATVDLQPARGSGPGGALAASTRGPLIAPWVLVGVGGVAAIVGAVLSGVAASDWSRLQDVDWRGRTSWDVVLATSNSYNQNVKLGPTVIGVGLAAAAGGLLWNILGRSKSQAGLTLVPSVNGLALAGAW